MPQPKSFDDVMNTVSWPLLNRQKERLLNAVEELSDPEDQAAVHGVINLIDALQDTAAEQGLWEFPDGDPETT